MSTNPGAPLENIPYIPKDPDTRMEVPVSLESEIELFTTKEFDEAILLHNTSALVPVLKKLCRLTNISRLALESQLFR